MKKTTSSSSGLLPRLVRQITRALKATKNRTFWEVIFDQDGMSHELEQLLAQGYSEREAMEAAITSVMDRHENSLCNAVREQCASAARAAFAKLPNS